MPSLAIGLVAALFTGWLLDNVVGTDGITSIWVAALFSAAVAIAFRLVIRAASFGGD
jgi:hypothetical protein